MQIFVIPGRAGFFCDSNEDTVTTRDILCLLRVHLVEGAVNAHGGAKASHTLVLLQAREYAPQGGGDQIGGAEGHDCAHVLHGETVFIGGLHPQPC